MSSSFQARSNSLPTRPHPLVLQCNEHLNRLKTFHETPSSSSSSSSLLGHNLQALQDLHDCVEKLVQLPLTHQALLQEDHADELLNGSLRLLDLCTASKDALLHTKECTRELQSIIRRRRTRGGGETELIAESRKFLTSRKVVRKAIFKALRNQKGTAKRCSNLYKDDDSFSLLRDVEAVTLAIFESLLNFISGSKESRWSMVSKLIQTRRSVTFSDENQFAKVDAELQSFVLEITESSISDLQKKLKMLESRIQDLEEGLEFLFRRLIRTRVSLLNILNH